MENNKNVKKTPSKQTRNKQFSILPPPPNIPKISSNIICHSSQRAQVAGDFGLWHLKLAIAGFSGASFSTSFPGERGTIFVGLFDITPPKKTPVK